MPVRRVPVASTFTTTSISEVKQWMLVLLIVAAAVVLGIVCGEHQPRTPALPPPIAEPYNLPRFDPVHVAQPKLHFGSPFSPVSLEHELHISHSSDGVLVATGLIVAGESVERIRVQAHRRGPDGELLASFDAVVACERLRAGERCGWALEQEFAGPLAELEVAASGRRAFEPGLPRLDLRSVRPGELEFDRERGTVEFEVQEGRLAEAWASVTAYDARGRVLDVALTRYAGEHSRGRHSFPLDMPRRADEADAYEVRVGGRLYMW